MQAFLCGILKCCTTTGVSYAGVSCNGGVDAFTRESELRACYVPPFARRALITSGFSHTVAQCSGVRLHVNKSPVTLQHTLHILVVQTCGHNLLICIQVIDRCWSNSLDQTHSFGTTLHGEVNEESSRT